MISTLKKTTLGSNQNLAILSITLLLLVVARDVLHSFVKNYSFYLYESLLFSTFWLIFIPLTLLCKRNSQKRFKVILAVVLSILHLSAFSFFVFLVSAFFFEDPFEFYRTFVNTSSKYGLVCILFYSFCAFLFVKNKPVLERNEYLKTQGTIKVNKKGKVIILDCNDIVYVKADKPYVAIITKDSRYLHKCTLKTFLKEYATKNFMQIHRSIIVNTDYIVSYTSRKNGDYDVQLTDQHNVRASRSYNKNFKSLLNNIGLE